MDHCEHCEHPKFIDVNFYYSPQINFQFDVSRKFWVWVLVGSVEPGNYLDCDSQTHPADPANDVAMFFVF